MLQQNDRSGEKLVVGSLEVIQEFKSSGLTRIESKIDMLDNKMTTEHLKTNDYWSALSDDCILTPVEKKTLKTNLEAEATQYAAIMAEAEKANAKNAKEVKEYDSYYKTFLNYIYNQLHCFDDMSANTEINDKETFNKMFADLQKYKQAAIDRIALENAKTAAHEISKDEIDIDHKGEYLGRVSVFPPTTADGVIHKGDWFVWEAATQTVAEGQVLGRQGNENKLVKGHVYRALIMNDQLVWEELDSTDVYNAKEMTTALGDILNVLKATDDAYYRSVFCSSLLTQSIQMPLASVIYAGNFDTAQEVKIGNTTTKLLTEDKDGDRVIQYRIAQGGIPNFAKDGKTLNKGFILSGNGDAAFTGVFRGDFLCDLFTVKKETVGADTKWVAKAGDDIFSAVAKLATLVGLNSASYTFTTPQTLNGQSITQFSYSYSPREKTADYDDYYTYKSYDHWTKRIYEGGRSERDGGRAWETVEHEGWRSHYQNYNVKEYTTEVAINGKKYQKIERTITLGDTGLTASKKEKSKDTFDALKALEYTVQTGALSLTDNHIFTDRTEITLAKKETVFSFTDDLPKKYTKQLPSGSIYEENGFLKVARPTAGNYFDVNKGDYTISRVFIGEFLIYYGTTNSAAQGSTTFTITFDTPYSTPPHVQLTNIQDGYEASWNHALLKVPITTKFFQCRVFSPRQGHNYWSRISFFVFGKV